MAKGRLEGKVAIITGGAGGIGEAAARLFATQGAFVVIVDIEDNLGRAVAVSIGPDKCTYHHCDVTYENQMEEVVGSTLHAHGRLDIMFSNAGIGGSGLGSILDMDLCDLDRIMAVNVRGACAAIKHAGRAMVARGTRGSIICNASALSLIGLPDNAAYTASNHAMLGLVRAAAGDLGGKGIRVNCVSPSLLATPLVCEFWKKSSSEVEAIGSGMARLKGVMLKAEHVAEAALYLASDESGFVSGHNLVVDGGFTASSPPTMVPSH